jgi:hypothetical protein
VWFSRLSDHRLLEVARRLSEDTADQRGASHEQNIRLNQEDALQYRTCTHFDLTSDLPEDVLRLCAANESHYGVLGLQKATRCL